MLLRFLFIGFTIQGTAFPTRVRGTPYLSLSLRRSGLSQYQVAPEHSADAFQKGPIAQGTPGAFVATEAFAQRFVLATGQVLAPGAHPAADALTQPDGLAQTILSPGHMRGGAGEGPVLRPLDWA